MKVINLNPNGNVVGATKNSNVTMLVELWLMSLVEKSFVKGSMLKLVTTLIQLEKLTNHNTNSY